MRPMIFTGMLPLSVPLSEAAATDLDPGAAARQVDALVRSLEGHFDRDTAAPFQAALIRERERLAAIRSRALLRAALDELAIQAGDPDLRAAREDARDTV